MTGCYPHFFCGLSCFLTTLGSDAPGRPWGGNGGELGGRAPRLQFAEGDVAWGAPTPTLLKTRAVGRVGGNGVLLPLNWDRHFGPLNQVRALEPGAPRFADRQPTAVWRGQPTGYDCNALTNPRMRLVRRWGGGRSRLSSDDDRVKIDVAFTSNQGSSTCPQMASRIPSAHRAKELRYQVWSSISPLPEPWMVSRVPSAHLAHPSPTPRPAAPQHSDLTLDLNPDPTPTLGPTLTLLLIRTSSAISTLSPSRATTSRPMSRGCSTPTQCL